ncbi:MAG: ABC-2 family transporter protein [Clostridium sp.]|jgi:ABC-2 type transport system permease protein|nr:ABC-2 family transporter protein [Clostridium sp.]
MHESVLSEIEFNAQSGKLWVRMKRYPAICVASWKIMFAKTAACRADFVMGSIMNLACSSIFPLVTVGIYRSGLTFPGYTMWQVLLIQSVYNMSNLTASALLGGVLRFSGNLEGVLLKPVPPLFYLIAVKLDPNRLIPATGWLAMTAAALANTGSVTLGGFAQSVLLYLAGLAFLCGFFLIMAALTFRSAGSSRLPEIFDSVKMFGNFPGSVFPKTIRVLTTSVIPVTLTGFLPASALLGNAEALSFQAVAPSILFLLLGILAYSCIIRLHKGVGK